MSLSAKINILYIKKKITISTGLKVVLGQYELFTDQSTRGHLAWTIGNGDPMHTVFLTHGNSKGEARR